jgi:hypothetical protein
VDHLVRVCILQGIQHLQNELQTLAHLQAVRIAPSGQPLAPYIFHREVGQSAGIDPGIVETRDLGMLKACQDVALARKALLEISSRALQRRQLQGHLAFEGTVGTAGQPHLRHPSCA